MFLCISLELPLSRYHEEKTNASCLIQIRVRNDNFALSINAQTIKKLLGYQLVHFKKKSLCLGPEPNFFF